MTEPTEINEIENEKPEKPKCGKVMRSLKIFVICMAILVLMEPVFGKLVPQLLFGNNEQIVGEPQTQQEVSEKPVDEQNTPIANVENTEKTAPEAEAVAPNPTIAPIVQNNTDTANNDARLQKLEDKISKLEAELTELKTKQETEKSISNQNVGLLPSLVVFGQLKDAVLSGKPYNDYLTQIRNLSANNAPAIAILDKLIENSEHGMITESELIKQYAPLAQQVMVGKNAGWIQKNSQKFLTIRKVGEQEGKEDEAVLARAETILNANPVYLYKALGELQNLSPNAKEIFAEWLANSAKLQEAKGGLERLQFILTQQPAQKTEPKP